MYSNLEMVSAQVVEPTVNVVHKSHFQDYALKVSKGKFRQYDFCLQFLHEMFIVHAACIMENLYTITMKSLQ